MFCFPCLSIPGKHRLKLSRLLPMAQHTGMKADMIESALP